MHAIITWLAAAGWLAVPHWGWVLFALLLLADYTLPRLKNPRARSIGEFLFNVQGLLLGRFPVLGPVAAKVALVAGTPQDGAATAKPDEPKGGGQ